jgi:outer membrane protein OmpA-like peptidoglycan-associated protein
MSVSKRFAATAAAVVLLTTTAACVTDPNTGERRVSKAAIGAVLGGGAGYLLGEVLGGRRDRTERIVGTGIGAVAGGLVGAYMDRQEQELRRQTAGTGVVIEREGDELLLTMPAGITFAHDRSDIQPQFQPTLDQVAQTLQAYPSTLIDVYGHTDSSGSDEYNKDLSQRRAVSVATILANQGVDQRRFFIEGRGEEDPIASNSNEPGRAQNRRVEIQLSPIET